MITISDDFVCALQSWLDEDTACQELQKEISRLDELLKKNLNRRHSYEVNVGAFMCKNVSLKDKSFIVKIGEYWLHCEDSGSSTADIQVIELINTPKSKES